MVSCHGRFLSKQVIRVLRDARTTTPICSRQPYYELAPTFLQEHELARSSGLTTTADSSSIKLIVPRGACSVSQHGLGLPLHLQKRCQEHVLCRIRPEICRWSFTKVRFDCGHSGTPIGALVTPESAHWNLAGPLWNNDNQNLRSRTYLAEGYQ